MTAHSNPRGASVVVVGGGASGLCAAISAVENGASVTVIDRAYGGGASAISGGIVYAGGGTKYQQAAGHHDTPDNMFRYLHHEIQGAVDDTTLRRFCDESIANLDWLESQGARFSGCEVPYKTSYPVGKFYLQFSGNEKTKAAMQVSKPAPRGHRTVGKGDRVVEMTGEALWLTLYESALRLGVKFEFASRVHELIIDGSGRVTGVRYRKMDESATWAASVHKWLISTANHYQTLIHELAGSLNSLADAIWKRTARQSKSLQADAVILAAGGFVSNRPMVNTFIPISKRTFPLGTAGCDGSGILLGQSVGGRVSHMDRISVWKFIYPPDALVEGVIVSPAGNRVAPEDLYGASLANAMIQHANGDGFLILDSLQWDKFKTQIPKQTHGRFRFLANYIKTWGHQQQSTLYSLAHRIRVDAGQLKSTLETYNDAIINGKPDHMGKVDYRSVIATGPFYAVDVSIQASGGCTTPALTLGGLDVDGESGLVLNEAGQTISGLYAAGRNAVGVCSYNYISGLSLADCVFSGRRAGTHAALCSSEHVRS